jgi:membrane-associated HD superfamily phosphohydrolase
MSNPTKVLGRSSIEFAIATIIAIVTAVVPMIWWLKSILALVAFAIIWDVAFHSPKTINLTTWKKYTILFIMLSIIGAVLLPPIWDDFHKIYPNIVFRTPLVIENEASETNTQTRIEVRPAQPACNCSGCIELGRSGHANGARGSSILGLVEAAGG